MPPDGSGRRRGPAGERSRGTFSVCDGLRPSPERLPPTDPRAPTLESPPSQRWPVERLCRRPYGWSSAACSPTTRRLPSAEGRTLDTRAKSSRQRTRLRGHAGTQRPLDGEGRRWAPGRLDTAGPTRAGADGAPAPERYLSPAAAATDPERPPTTGSAGIGRSRSGSRSSHPVGLVHRTRISHSCHPSASGVSVPDNG